MSERRDDVLLRLAGRQGPRDPSLQTAWRRLPPTEQDRLRRAAADPTAAAHLHDDLNRQLVDALAADRAAQRRVDIAVPVFTALLVLSTVWGFGRAVVPDAAGWFLAAGLVAAAITTVTGWRRRAETRRAARRVRQVLRSG